jgi:hypothetical protein
MQAPSTLVKAGTAEYICKATECDQISALQHTLKPGQGLTLFAQTKVPASNPGATKSQVRPVKRTSTWKYAIQKIRCRCYTNRLPNSNLQRRAVTLRHLLPWTFCVRLLVAFALLSAQPTTPKRGLISSFATNMLCAAPFIAGSQRLVALRCSFEPQSLLPAQASPAWHGGRPAVL